MMVMNLAQPDTGKRLDYCNTESKENIVYKVLMKYEGHPSGREWLPNSKELAGFEWPVPSSLMPAGSCVPPGWASLNTLAPSSPSADVWSFLDT